MPYREVEIDAKGSLLSASVGLIINLTNRLRYFAKARLSVPDWPLQRVREA